MPINIKPLYIEIPEDDPFKNCKLNRKQYSDILTSIISNNDKGFVLSIDNNWGYGKTTFIKMWEQSLKNDDYKCVYFNAWENDFENNAMTALLSELKSITGDPSKFDSLLKKGSVLIKNMIPVVLNSIASRYIETKGISELIKEISDAGTGILEEEVNNYISKKAGLIEFKKELSKYVKETNTKPLIFFVDELDRCNPHYSVEVLEKIKHLFSVDGIVFVLSIDKEQLCNSIKGYFGSEKINSNEYLKRFIDIEFSIPRPTQNDYCDFLYDYHSFGDFIDNEERNKFSELRNERKELIDFSVGLFSHKNITLRQQEKVFSHARIALKSYQVNSFLLPSVFIFLVYLRTFHKEIFIKMTNKEYTNQALLSELESLINLAQIDKDFLLTYINVCAKIITMYNYGITNSIDKNLFVKGGGATISYFLKSKITFNGNNDALNKQIVKFCESRSSSIKIDHFLNKIDLLTNLSS